MRWEKNWNTPQHFQLVSCVTLSIRLCVRLLVLYVPLSKSSLSFIRWRNFLLTAFPLLKLGWATFTVFFFLLSSLLSFNFLLVEVSVLLLPSLAPLPHSDVPELAVAGTVSVLVEGWVISGNSISACLTWLLSPISGWGWLFELCGQGRSHELGGWSWLSESGGWGWLKQFGGVSSHPGEWWQFLKALMGTSSSRNQ